MNEELKIEIPTEMLIQQIGGLTIERDAWKRKAQELHAESLQLRQELQVMRLIRPEDSYSIPESIPGGLQKAQPAREWTKEDN